MRDGGDGSAVRRPFLLVMSVSDTISRVPHPSRCLRRVGSLAIPRPLAFVGVLLAAPVARSAKPQHAVNVKPARLGWVPHPSRCLRRVGSLATHGLLFLKPSYAHALRLPAAGGCDVFAFCFSSFALRISFRLFVTRHSLRVRRRVTLKFLDRDTKSQNSN